MLRNWSLVHSATDADALAWAAAVTAGGGTYSGTTLAALSTFIASAKASNYWTKIAPCFNPMCGNQLAACLIQLKGGVWAPATNVNFVSGDYTEATGLTGNGSSKYLTTGLVPSVSLSANDTHLAVYNRSSTAATGLAGIGAWSDATPTNAMSILAPLSDGKVYSDQYNAVAGRASTAVIGTPFGFLIGTRTASNVHTVYRNGSSAASNATSGGALPAIEAYVFAINQAGAPKAAGWGAGPLAAYSIGSGLSAADVTAYNTHMQAFQTALSRQV